LKVRLWVALGWRSATFGQIRVVWPCPGWLSMTVGSVTADVEPALARVVEPAT
jgi:hypothetical protein